jgi:hypothetical protein
MTSKTAHEAVQRFVRGWAFAAPLLQSQSPQRSEDAASPEQSSVTCPGQCATEQESEGGCLLLCLYLADRCDRNCAGCSVTAKAAAGTRLRGGAAAQRERQSARNPDGNHGESNSTGGESA